MSKVMLEAIPKPLKAGACGLRLSYIAMNAAL